jgi:hypothetical protein
MSVTEYLTDHNGNRVAFFYYIDSERYSVVPKLVWQCRDHRQYKGTCASKEEAFEAFKAVLKELKRKVPVHACDNELLMSEASNGVKSEAKPCDKCGLTNYKMEGQSTCPECLTEPTTNK